MLRKSYHQLILRQSDFESSKCRFLLVAFYLFKVYLKFLCSYIVATEIIIISNVLNAKLSSSDESLQMNKLRFSGLVNISKFMYLASSRSRF